VYATFPCAAAFIPAQNASGKLGVIVFSCDYNGWADMPEEEREAIAAFEASVLPSIPRPVPLTVRMPPPRPTFPVQRAA
jgi:hypothetical protein